MDKCIKKKKFIFYLRMKFNKNDIFNDAKFTKSYVLITILYVIIFLLEIIFTKYILLMDIILDVQQKKSRFKIIINHV